MFDTIEQARLSELHIASDPDSQLRAIVAIHSTHLGPALGGCRFIEYDSEADALEDAVRLAQGMSYKAALAGVAQGGGKSVILKPANLRNREALFAAFGRFVDNLGGRYITAVDSGSTPDDMEIISQHTAHVVGTRSCGGDPSPSTALGVLEGIRSCVKTLYDRHTLSGMHVAIQGIGNVGFPLAQMLYEEGVQLTISDINQQRLDHAAQLFGARIVAPEAIHKVECDIFAPCGLGAVINDTTLPELQCKAVAGSANNQLHREAHGAALHEKGILYAPDYIINAGGLIHVCLYKNGISEEAIQRKVTHIGQTLMELFTRAQTQQQCTSSVANMMAEERLQQPTHCDQHGDAKNSTTGSIKGGSEQEGTAA